MSANGPTDTKGRHYFKRMPRTHKPDPELLPMPAPRCPNCQTRMINVAVIEGPEGFEQREFECRKCAHAEVRVVACDPFKSDAIGWTKSELNPPK